VQAGEVDAVTELFFFLKLDEGDVEPDEDRGLPSSRSSRSTWCRASSSSASGRPGLAARDLLELVADVAASTSPVAIRRRASSSSGRAAPC
jgi:hypothetical protein